MKKIISKRIIQLLFLGLYLASVIVIYSQMRIQRFMPFYVLCFVSYFLPLIAGGVLLFVNNEKIYKITAKIMLIFCSVILIMRIVVPFVTVSSINFKFLGISFVGTDKYGLLLFVNNWAFMNSIGTPQITPSIVHFLFRSDVISGLLTNYLLPCISTVLIGIEFLLLSKGVEKSIPRIYVKRVGEIFAVVFIALLIILTIRSCDNGGDNDYPRGFEECFRCHGSGLINEGFLDFETCPTCGGSGMLDSH